MLCLVVHNDFTHAFGNTHLNTLNGIRLMSALESVLCYFGLPLTCA